MSKWKVVPGSLMEVSSGSAAHIWGVNKGNAIYQFVGNWVGIPGGLKWVSVGSDGTVWGVNKNDVIYRREGESWKKISGGLSQISVGSASEVWGVNKNQEIYKYTGDDNHPWDKIPGGLKNVSVGSDGTVWGVNINDTIYYYVKDSTLLVSDPHLEEEQLEQGDTAAYSFSVTNVVPRIIVKDVKLQLLYDNEAFTNNGVTITPDTITVPGQLVTGTPVEVGFSITATQNATPMDYGIWGIRASYTVSPVPGVNTAVESNEGGWLAFKVVPD